MWYILYIMVKIVSILTILLATGTYIRVLPTNPGDRGTTVYVGKSAAGPYIRTIPPKQ
jgi:hypothetical protein